MKINTMCSMLVLGTAVLSTPASMPRQIRNKFFLTRAAEADAAEIKQSQIALDKTTDPEVRDFAQKMIADHTALEVKMKPFAAKYSFTPDATLTVEHQAEITKLSGLSGKDFDMEYISSMEKDHRAALMLFADERGSSKDKELVSSSSDAYDTVAMHIKMANKLAGKLGVTIPSAMTPSDSTS